MKSKTPSTKKGMMAKTAKQVPSAALMKKGITPDKAKRRPSSGK